MMLDKLKYGLLAMVLTLAACVGTIHGGGVVYFFDVNTGYGPGQPTSASIAVSLTCNDARDMFRSTLHLTDTTNGANFTAMLPWVPVSEVGQGISSCQEAADFVNEFGASFVFGIINSQGQESGTMAALVAQEGVASDCAADEQLVAVSAIGIEDALPGGLYEAVGCLVKGNIVFE